MKETIFAKIDRKLNIVKTPEWGIDIYVQSMSCAERSRFKTLADVLDKEGKSADCDVWLCIFCCVDESGVKIFDTEDFDKLNDKNSSIISRISKEALVVNGLTNTSIEDAKKN